MNALNVLSAHLARNLFAIDKFLFSSAYGNSIILVSPVINIFAEFRRGHPLWGVDIDGLYKFRDVRPISGYVGNDRR